MSYKFTSCIETRGLRKCVVSRDIIEKDILESRNDLISAKTSLDEADFKWAIIKAYYSMFHGGKSLVLSAGYTEKSHECVIIAVEELFTRRGNLPGSVVVHLKEAKSAREAADYGLTYGENAAHIMIKEAGEVYLHISGYLGKQGYMVIPPDPDW
jgi:uncharacterized protein (UPF0332 family)